MNRHTGFFYRVYLVERGRWREFGADYETCAAAIEARDAFRRAFPERRYVARRIWR